MPDTRARNKKIKEMRQKGMQLNEIGEAFGLTRQRIFSILKKLSTVSK